MGFGGRWNFPPDAWRCGNVGFRKGFVQFSSEANAGFPSSAFAAERSGIVSSFDVICFALRFRAPHEGIVRPTKRFLSRLSP